MQIAHNAYTAHREASSRFEASKKELPLKISTTHRTEAIKKMFSEGGPESVLATKSEYSRMRTFAAGSGKQAVLAFSPQGKRVDGFVLNKEQQLVPIKPYDLPKELQQILNSDAFEAFLKDVHSRLVQLHNGDFRLDIHQSLKGGVYSKQRDSEHIKESLGNLGTRKYQSRIILENECEYPLKLTHQDIRGGSFSPNYPWQAFEKEGDDYKIPRGAAGGILCNGKRGIPKPTEGYISLTIPTPGRNYTVICAFGTGFFGVNSAKIEIRCEDGNTNELGVVVGHGVDATGHVTDMKALFAGCVQHQKTSQFTRFNLGGRMFHVYCKFDNDAKANFHFKFTNPPEDLNTAPVLQPQPQSYDKLNTVTQVQDAVAFGLNVIDAPPEDPNPAPVLQPQPQSYDKLNTATRVQDAVGFGLNVIDGIIQGMSATQSQRNQNQKTEEKLNADSVKVNEEIHGSGEESAPAAQPHASFDLNSSELVPQIMSGVSNLINSDFSKNFVSSVMPVFNAQLNSENKAENTSEELKKEDEQNEQSD
jgi:hypothetical protein